MRKDLEINVLRESIANITKILAGKSIRVTQRGSQAYVTPHKITGKPERVNLPYIPDNASETLINAINGFLDHEVGHVLFTDFNVFRKVLETRNAVLKEYFNIIEDTFVERKMQGRFRGSAANLDHVRHFYLEKYVTEKYEAAIAIGDEKAAFGALMVSAFRAWSGQQVFEDYMSDKWSVVSRLAKIVDKDMRKRIANIENSAESLAIAQEIHDKLQENQQGSGGRGQQQEDEGSGKGTKQPDKKQTKSQGQSNEPSENEQDKQPGDKQESNVADKQKEDGKEKSDDGDKQNESGSKPDEDKGDEPEEKGDEPEEKGDEQENESEEVENDAETEENESEEVENDAKTEGSDHSENESENEADDDEPEESDHSGDAGTLPEEVVIESPLTLEEVGEATNAGDFDDTVAEKISNVTQNEMSSADYSIFTNEFDLIEPLPIGDDYRDYYLENLDNETKTMVGLLQKGLERLVVARTQSRWVPGLKSGRVNSSSLYKLKTKDTRVFRRREANTETKDVAFSLVVDCSGSMKMGNRYGDHKPITLAMIAAYAMSTVLERLGVAHEVIGFTTRDMHFPAEVRQEIKKEIDRGAEYARYLPIYMPIFKGFDERLTTEPKRRFAYASHADFLHVNVDGESVEIAAQRLLKRPEHGKTMFVLSDGRPNAGPNGNNLAQHEHLKRVVEKYNSKAGVSLVGIGIASKAVENYYPEHVVLSEAHELPGMVMDQLKRIILGKINKS